MRLSPPHSTLEKPVRELVIKTHRMDLPTRRFPFSNRAFVVGIGLLLVIHAWVALSASRHKSTTNDEIAHITGGYAANALSDFRVQPENGVLPQRWHALPFTVQQPALPNLESGNWTRGVAFQFSYDFFYRSGHDPDQLLFAGRAMNVVWGLGVILLVGIAARQLAGNAAGLFAAALPALSPTMLVHSALATSDMAMTFFFVASTLAFWWQTHQPGWRSTTVSAVVFGLACVAKFSAVLLLPMLVLLSGIRVVSGPAVEGLSAKAEPRLSRVKVLVLSLLVHGITAWVVIWIFFGLRFSMMSPDVPAGTMPLAWENVLSTHPAWEGLIFGLRDLRILPEAFLYGFSYVLAFSEARGAFLDGALGTEGWFSFFPKAFLYKTPPAELLAMVVAMVALGLSARRAPAEVRRYAYGLSPLLVLFGIYWASSLTTNLNIGHRHILPTYPALWAGCGLLVATVAMRAISRPRLVIFAILGLLAIQLSTAIRVFPHYLGYFSPIAGGPQKGYQRLVDSSLDWGQDLPGLGEWWRERADRDQPLHVAYFGTGEPTTYGIDAPLIARLPTFNISRPWIELKPGYYAISATMLQHVYRQQHQPWSADSEQLYQSVRNAAPAMFQMAGRPAEHPDLLDGATPDEWSHAWTIFEELRFARLCEYLKVRPPDAMIGYSILIFELTESELAGALHGDIAALANAIEAASTADFAPETY